MSARLIALARAQAAGLRSALSACEPAQAALKARLATAADTLDGLASITEQSQRRSRDIADRLVAFATELRDLGGAEVQS